MINRQALETIASWMANLVGTLFFRAPAACLGIRPEPPKLQSAAGFTAQSFHVLGTRLVDLVDSSRCLQLLGISTISIRSSDRILTTVRGFGTGFISRSTAMRVTYFGAVPVMGQPSTRRPDNRISMMS